MDQHDRAIIDHFCNTFLTEINISTLLPQLIENKVFNKDDVNIPIWEKNLTDPETVRDILLTIKTRGPNAFENLVRSLRQSDHYKLANILQDYEIPFADNDISNNDDSSTNSESTDDDFYKNLHYATTPLQINVKKATEFCDGTQYKNVGKYVMRSRPRGYVLIITNISYISKKKREAAEHDEASLNLLFKQMGFQVTSKMNLTGAEMKRVVKEFSQRNFHLVDSCFVIISAHGAESNINGFRSTEIEGIDCDMPNAERVLCTDIIDYFTTENCNFLSGKPKVFIFQACRGHREQIPARIVSDGFENKAPPRNYSDILVAHSTIPGHVAYRNIVNGSWYIQILCEVFMNYACTMHLQDLFNMVDRRLMDLRTDGSKSQTSTVESIGFNKHCYLNPGLFEDS